MAKTGKSDQDLRLLAKRFRELSTEFVQAQQLLAILAARAGGTLVIDAAELARIPAGSAVYRTDHPDGRVVLHMVTDELAEPGSGG